MHFISFLELLPKIAEKETRRVTIKNDPHVPDGEYAFVDAHCGDKTCDCRRAFINVVQIDPNYQQGHVATISYGWESFAFYRKWSHGLTNDMLTEFKGPCLDHHQKQSVHAPFFLEFFKNILLMDTAYINRLKRHYALFKWKTGMKLPKDIPFDPTMPCPCGSGAKYKFCCGKRGNTVAHL